MPAVSTPIRRDQSDSAAADAVRYELRFTELFNAGRGFVFPCDARGQVDLDQLTDRARMNYFLARTTIGRQFSCPVTREVVE